MRKSREDSVHQSVCIFLAVAALATAAISGYLTRPTEDEFDPPGVVVLGP